MQKVLGSSHDNSKKKDFLWGGGALAFDHIFVCRRLQGFLDATPTRYIKNKKLLNPHEQYFSGVQSAAG